MKTFLLFDLAIELTNNSVARQLSMCEFAVQKKIGEKSQNWMRHSEFWWKERETILWKKSHSHLIFLLVSQINLKMMFGRLNSEIKGWLGQNTNKHAKHVNHNQDIVTKTRFTTKNTQTNKEEQGKEASWLTLLLCFVLFSSLTHNNRFKSWMKEQTLSLHKVHKWHQNCSLLLMKKVLCSIKDCLQVKMAMFLF